MACTSITKQNGSLAFFYHKSIDNKPRCTCLTIAACLFSFAPTPIQRRGVRLEAAAPVRSSNLSLQMLHRLKSCRLAGVSTAFYGCNGSATRLLTYKRGKYAKNKGAYKRVIRYLSKGQDDVPVNKHHGGTVMTDQLYGYLLSHTAEHEVQQSSMHSIRPVQSVLTMVPLLSCAVKYWYCRYSDG
jgi:hypothetical protein